MKDEKDNATLNAVFDQDTAQPTIDTAPIGETTDFTPVDQPEVVSDSNKNVRGRILAGAAIVAAATGVGVTVASNNGGEQTAKGSPDPIRVEAKVAEASPTQKIRTDSENPNKVIVKVSTKPEAPAAQVTPEVKPEGTAPTQPIEQYSSYGNVPPKQSGSVNVPQKPSQTGGATFEAPSSKTPSPETGGATYDSSAKTVDTGSGEAQPSGGASYTETPTVTPSVGGVQSK